MTLLQHILFIIIIMLSCPLYNAACQDHDIAEIRNKYAEIRNKLKSFQIRNIELSGESTEGGSLTAYSDDTLIKLIIEEHAGETGKRIVEYYYSNQHLIFIYNITLSYNRPIYLDSVTAMATGDMEWYDPLKSLKTEERFYFKDDRLIRWIDKTQQPVTIRSEKFNQKSDEMINQSNKVLSVFFSTEQ